MNSGTIRHAIDPELLGEAKITPDGRFEAGSFASFTLVYTAGRFGIDDSGSLRICFRFASDQGSPQFSDPSGANYCTVEASNGAVLELRWDPKGNVRPWDRTLWIKVVRGFLEASDTITARFGVTDHGGPGMRLQTFCEETFEFRVLVDPIATFNFQTLPVQPAIAIVPGKPERFVAAIPTLRRPGQTFDLKVKGEDRWGNPSDQCDRIFFLAASRPVDGLPDRIILRPGQRSFTVPDLKADAGEDAIVVTLSDENGGVVAETNPLLIEDRSFIHYWADMHGQSEETIGTGSAREYFAFARDLAWVDACGHQGNDFQIDDAFWGELNRITAEFDAPGEFVALPGYEWSGNTSLGGDRNVFFPSDDRVIRRSSHALIEDQSDTATDCHTAADLFEAFAEAREFDVVCYAHCGGRYADIGFAHDGRFERSVEVHSSWGTFEWLLHDALKLGYRVGVVTNSDGHKGRPGASYPGAGKFGAIGGLTCFQMEELSRGALLDCMRKRHHYGTTGGASGRMALTVAAEFDAEARIYHDDPALGPAEAVSTARAMMGDIVHLPNGEVELSVSISAGAPIERVDLFNGLDLLETVRPYTDEELGSRLRIHWEGAEYRGRFREVVWDGGATVSGNAIERAEPINFLNPDKTLDHEGPGAVRWAALTTGNFGGADLVLSERDSGTLSVKTPLISFEVPIAEVGMEDVVHDASDRLPRFLKVYRLPDTNPHRSMAFRRPLDLKPSGDNAIHVRVTLEDGTRAWTSPIYIARTLA